MPLLSIFALSAPDLADYAAGVQDGHELVAELNHYLPVIPPGGVLAVPAVANRGDVSIFILEGDLKHRLQLEREMPAASEIRVTLETEDPDVVSDAHRYDPRSRK